MGSLAPRRSNLTLLLPSITHRFRRHQEGGLQDSKITKSSLSGPISITLDATYTNASLEAELCSQVATMGVDQVDAVFMNFPDFVDRYSLADPLLMPDCFWTLTAVQTVSLERVILTGTNAGTSADPLIRLPSTASVIILFDSTLVNPTTSGDSYKPDWTALFASKPGLAWITLQNVRLEATIPSTIPQLLKQFNVAQNPLFTGSIPSTLFSNFPSSQTDIRFSFPNNNLNGTIPADLFDNAHSQMERFTFSVAGNALTGPYPPNLIKNLVWPNCYYGSFDFSENKLTGSMPANVLPSVGWTSNYVLQVNMGNNQLSGSIPSTLFAASTAQSLRSFYLNASSNAIMGSIPPLYGSVDPTLIVRTISLFFGNNQLSESIPSANLWTPETMGTTETTLDFSSNQLSGQVPDDLLAASPFATTTLWLDLSNNKLTGTLNPAVISSGNYNDVMGMTLSFARNQLSGPLDTAFFDTIQSQRNSFQIDLSHNSLGGTIPSDIFASFIDPLASPFYYLGVFINNCSLSGTLPVITPKVFSFSLSADDNQLSAIPAASWSAYLTTAFNTINLSSYLSFANNLFDGELTLPSREASFSAQLNFYGNNFTQLTIPSVTKYIVLLNVGMNEYLNGSLPAAWLDGTGSMDTLIANHTALSGDFPDVSGAANFYLRQLVLSDTAINFCPNFTAPWTSEDLTICDLGTNAKDCIEFYPAVCKKVEPPLMAPVATPIEVPIETPVSVPSAVPTASPIVPPAITPSPVPTSPPRTTNVPTGGSLAMTFNLAILIVALLAASLTV